MNRRVFLGSAALLIGCGSAPTVPGEEAASQPSSPTLVPVDFEPPIEVEGDGFVLVPLDTQITALDYAAYMSSIEHLQQTFTFTTSWPNADVTMEAALQDMENEQAQFESRKSFPYAVLNPERTKELGCVYVRPSKKEGYDAAVRLWVTAESFAAGFDEELYVWTQHWVESAWPFENVAYPGRRIPMDEWEELPAKS
jgi:hypothetical protein